MDEQTITVEIIKQDLQRHARPWYDTDIRFLLARLSQVAAEIAEKEDEHDKELGHWQEAIRDLVIKVSGAPDSEIDGGGDSGDPLDLSLSEITQGLNFLIDQLDELRANHGAEVAAEKEKVWQPISTAPKDNYLLLANERGVTQGYWDREAEAEGGQCWRLSDPDMQRFDIVFEAAPTHWMPLPERPALEIARTAEEKQDAEV